MFGSNKVHNVGVIGLGIIGSRVAECLRKANQQVFVWSKTTRPEPNFMASPQEIAEICQVIQIFVRDSEALMEVLEQMRPALQPHHIVLNHSTVSLDGIKKAADLVAETRAHFLDAPFTGSRGAAEKGELVYYVGGDEPTLEKVRKILEASSRKILPFGKVGEATVLKIATNLVSASVVEALAEALALVKAHGIAGEKLLEALVPNANCSPLVTMKLPAMIAGNYEPQFSLQNMLKDARYAQELGKGQSFSTPVLDSVVASMEAATAKGHGDKDFSALNENFSPRP